MSTTLTLLTLRRLGYLRSWKGHSRRASAQAVTNFPARPLGGVLLSAILMLGSLQTARADDEDVIGYRQLIMKEVDAETAALGMIVAGLVPPDALPLQAKALANSAKSAPGAFEPKVPGGEAKPEVWSKPDDFSKRMQMFVQKADEIAKASEGGNVQAVNELTGALPCKECHDVYRNKKK